eukprot:298914_1
MKRLLFAGVACVCGILFYIRRQIQGYYFDYKAILSVKNVKGRTAIITGGNSGIGLGTAIHLAKLQCNVIIACRNVTKAAKAVEYIKLQSGNKNVSSLNLDLSDISSIESCASTINKNDNMDIDYLILNAGVGPSTASSSTKQGLSLLFQTNYFGHWYLTNLLLNKIKQTANKRWNKLGNKYGVPVRIVCVSSGSHSSAHIPLDNNKWKHLTKDNCSYGQSKLLQILHMKLLQKELNSNGYDSKIQCVSITPGLVRTNIINKETGILLYCLIILIYPLWWYLSRDIMMGSQVVLHVCCNDDIVSGGYYSNCRLKKSKGKNGCSNDMELCQQIWNKSKLLLQSIKS